MELLNLFKHLLSTTTNAIRANENRLDVGVQKLRQVCIRSINHSSCLTNLDVSYSLYTSNSSAFPFFIFALLLKAGRDAAEVSDSMQSLVAEAEATKGKAEEIASIIARDKAKVEESTARVYFSTIHIIYSQRTKI